MGGQRYGELVRAVGGLYACLESEAASLLHISWRAKVPLWLYGRCGFVALVHGEERPL